MTIECKDLEWREDGKAFGVLGNYQVTGAETTYDAVYTTAGGLDVTFLGEGFNTRESAQAAANEHNKQQFNAIIEEWRKG